MIEPKLLKTKQVPELSPERINLFWANVDIGDTNECWEWQRAKVKGYGVTKITVKGLRAQFYAHRVAYAIEHGDVPPGYVVNQTCKNLTCCNPRHLQAVLMSDAHAFGEVMGPVTPELIQGVWSMYQEGGRTHLQIADEFSISRKTVGNIVNRERIIYQKVLACAGTTN